jgi:hemerythrin-like metal-binding protein
LRLGKDYEESGFPGLGAHQALHQQLTKQAGELMEKIKAGKMVLTVSLASLLKDWLVNHIQGQDKQYGKHIANLQTSSTIIVPATDNMKIMRKYI